ncbi:MAG: hypothetical protein ABSB70_22410 [Candidatus Velthaea sp.]
MELSSISTLAKSIDPRRFRSRSRWSRSTAASSLEAKCGIPRVSRGRALEAIPFPLDFEFQQCRGVDAVDGGDRGNDGLRDAFELALLVGFEGDIVDRGVVAAAFVLQKEIERGPHQVP